VPPGLLLDLERAIEQGIDRKGRMGNGKEREGKDGKGQGSRLVISSTSSPGYRC